MAVAERRQVGSASADERARMPPPASQVTLLFTDIEGSTALWEEDAARMSQALAVHDALARNAIEARRRNRQDDRRRHDCRFRRASAALAATLELQQALHASAASDSAPLRVRCGLHRGIVEHRDGDYFGNRMEAGRR